MMRAIAKRFSEGGFTLPELATELDMGQDALLERLFMMERLGFIVRSGGRGVSGALYLQSAVAGSNAILRLISCRAAPKK